MDELTHFARFLPFALAFALLVYLQLYLAHRQWGRLKGEQDTEIDVSYVQSESFLAQSFRSKLNDWLQLPASESGNGGRVIMKDRETIRVTGARTLGAKERCDDILVVEGDFSCGDACDLTRELCVRGNARIGRRSRLQALAADGDLEVGDQVTVARWLDSSGELTLGAGCQAGARVTSLKHVRLGENVQVASAYAPQVSTTGWNGELPSTEPAADDLITINFAEKAPADDILRDLGLEPERFVRLGGDCWIYKGDARFTRPVRVTNKLVVKGDCYLSQGSVLESDFKAAGSLFLGPGSVAKGNLIAGREIRLERGCRFSGLVHAGKSLRLMRGVRGFRTEGPLAIFGGESVLLEADVAVMGKVASGGAVRVVKVLKSI